MSWRRKHASVTSGARHVRLGRGWSGARWAGRGSLRGLGRAQDGRARATGARGPGRSSDQAAASRRTHSQGIPVIRGHDLRKSMSSYLAQRIEKTPNIEVLCSTRVSRMSGDRYLQSAEIVDMETGEVRTLETPALFSFIGAAEDRLAAEGNRDELLAVCSHRSGFDAVALGFAPAAAFAGDQPSRRVRCGRCFARVRSSGSLPPSARERWRCSLSKSI